MHLEDIMEHQTGGLEAIEKAKGIGAFLITLTADIASAHVSHNEVSSAELPTLISEIHEALSSLKAPVRTQEEKPKPAVSIRTSIRPEYIVCLEDGKKLKMLKRYLEKHYGMTPEQYRQKWNLPASYPMVAPAYAAARKELALKIGLGRHSGIRRSPREATVSDVTVADGVGN